MTTGAFYDKIKLKNIDAVGEGIEIEYNADGIRVYMYTPNATHYYTVDGSTILEEKIVDSYGVHYLVYVYDETGAPIAIKYSDDNTTFSYYFFEKNLQGDIVGIYNASGTQIGTYVYDAWGNVTTSETAGISSTDRWIVNNNPFRYRGYYYDVETGWYYLQTRYYDPEIGRFLNADGYVSTGQGLLGYNMFAYCNNNPIMGYDPCGTCFHRLDFWNDCEECGGKTFGDKLIAAAEWVDDNIIVPAQRFAIEVTFAAIDIIDPDNDINSIQIGKTFSAGCGGQISISWGVVFDRSGNIADYITFGFGASAGCGVSISGNITTSDAPDISKLTGWGFNMGGSVVFGVGAGYDYGKCIGNPYSTHTGSILVGIGPMPVEFHAQMTYTWQWHNRNVYQ